MKGAIRKVLDKYSNSQINLSSEVAKDILAEEIYQEILLCENESGREKEVLRWFDENDKTNDCGGV